MPFKPVHTLPTSPTVTVYFSGLLLIRCLNDYTCEIGVINNAPPHRLKINLRVIEPDSTRTILLHAGDLKDNFWIDAENAIPPGVYAFEQPSYFSRSTQNDNGHDLRWAIDLEGDEFHREKLSPDSYEAKIHPGVIMTSGVFYAGERTDEATVHIVRERSQTYGMSSIAGVIAACIDIVPGSHVILRWPEGGRDQVVKLPRAEDKPGTKYELNISNEPPEGTATDPDELVNYYKVLTKANGNPIPDGEKWRLGPPKHLTVNTDEIPCMPVLLNGGQ